MSKILETCVVCFLVSWKYWTSVFCIFYKKDARRKNDEECNDFRAEISHMRPIQGQKLKLFVTPFCGVINLPVE